MILVWEASYLVLGPGLSGSWTWATQAAGALAAAEQGFMTITDGLVTGMVLSAAVVSPGTVDEGLVTGARLTEN